MMRRLGSSERARDRTTRAGQRGGMDGRALSCLGIPSMKRRLYRRRLVFSGQFVQGGGLFIFKMKLEDLPHPEDGAAALEIPGYPRRRWFRLAGMCAGAVGLGGAANYWVYPPPIPPLMFDGRFAHARPEHPPVIHSLVLYCNQLQGQPYKWGGGHRYLYDNGFDCSGSISHVLFRAGLLTQPLNSTHFANYGHPGPGKYVSLFIRPGHHVFMSVCGFRFDTTGGREGEGPAWRIRPRDPKGFINRHPPGL